MQSEAWVLLTFTSSSPVLAGNRLTNARAGSAETVQRDWALVESPFPVWPAGS